MHLISLKTRAHFCQSPKSAVESATSGGTKLTAALVHGFGESAYYYWAADQVCHDTNLTAEVIRRVLLRIDDLNKLKGDVPLCIFTAGDASNNKSSHFLTFIVYLVEMKVLDLRWTICSLAWLVQESCTKDEVLGAQTWFLKVNWKYWRKGTFDAKETSIGVFEFLMWVLLCPILFNSHPWTLTCHCWSKTKYPLYFWEVTTQWVSQVWHGVLG